MKFTPILALTVLAIAPFSSQAATTRTWTNNNGLGDFRWSTPANWNPAGVPEAGDSVSLTSGGSVSQTIIYDFTGFISLASLNISKINGASNDGVNTLSINSTSVTLLSANDQFVGWSENSTNARGNVIHSNGFDIVNNALVIGYNASDIGTYNLTGAAQLTVLGSETIGNLGSGTLNQTGGYHNAGNLTISAGGSGAYNLSAFGELQATTLTIASAGIGTFTQSGGSAYINSLRVADGGLGTYTLNAGALVSTDGETIGNKTALGTFTQNGGTHILSTSLGNLRVGGSDPGPGGIYNLNAGTLSVGGDVLIGINAPGVFNQTGGSHDINGGNSLYVGLTSTGSYNLSGGTFAAQNIEIRSAGQLNYSGGAITTNEIYINGGTANFLASAAPVVINTLTFAGATNAWSGKLNLNTALALRTADASDKSAKLTGLINQLQQGRGNGNWLGAAGITSADAAAHPSGGGAKTDGHFDNAPRNLNNIGPGGPAIDSSVLILADTLSGDTNLDHKVDLADLTAIANHWQTAQLTWATGDITLDGFVDLADLTAVANNWQAGVPPDFTSSESFSEFPQLANPNVPEPFSLLLLFPSLLAFRRRPSK